MPEEKLKLMADNVADLYGPIRFVFLSANIDKIQVLTIEQIQMYSRGRGYDTNGHWNLLLESKDDNNSNSVHKQYSFK